MSRFLCSIDARGPAVLAALALLTSCGEPPAPRHETPAAVAAPAAVEGAAGEAAAPPPHRRHVELIRQMWWNRPAVVEALALDAGQRRSMDARFADYLAARRDRRAGADDDGPGFRGALRAGDLDAARAWIERRGATAAAAATADARVMLDVLELLRPEQLERLRDELPQILDKPWFVALKGGRSAPPRATREAAPADGDG